MNKKPTPTQVLKLLEDANYVCEWGQCKLTEEQMTELAMFVHIGLGTCPNKHNDWRKFFWKKQKTTIKEHLQWEKPIK